MKEEQHKEPVRTLRFGLEPDPEIPPFRRLRWEWVPVSIAEVLSKGIHPWTEAETSPSLAEALLARVNDPASRVAALEEFGLGHDVSGGFTFTWHRIPNFERTLEVVRKEVRFVEDLTYAGLLEIAKERLMRKWSHALAKEMAMASYPGFTELRQFLKAKDKSLKLASYEDVERYDLGKVLSLADFAERDTLLIQKGIPITNFRLASSLDRFTEERGRLSLVPEIRHVTLTLSEMGPEYVPLVWQVERRKQQLVFRPVLENGGAKRVRARAFAEAWRTDGGRYCFITSMERLVEMVERRIVMPSFPSLSYNGPVHGVTASALVAPSRISVFHIPRPLTEKATGDRLKAVLGEHGVSMTGNKEQLIAKLAKLAAAKYTERLTELDGYFRECRYIRVGSGGKGKGEFPLLEDLPSLKHLLLSMYALKHLRGNAILEACHENDAYTVEEVAMALLAGRVDLSGGFLRVV